MLLLGARLATVALVLALPPTEAKLVLRNGTQLVVRSYAVEGSVVHLVSLKGEPQIMRTELVDLRRSESATAAHRKELEAQARKENAAEQQESSKRDQVREANETHRARSSGRRGINVGTGDKAQIVDDVPYESDDQARDRLRAALARSDRVLLYFQAERCADCRRVESEVLSQPVVMRALEGYELRSVDIDADAGLARKHGISKVPTFVVLDGDDKTLARLRGFQPADAFAAWLER